MRRNLHGAEPKQIGNMPSGQAGDAAHRVGSIMPGVQDSRKD